MAEIIKHCAITPEYIYEDKVPSPTKLAIIIKNFRIPMNTVFGMYESDINKLNMKKQNVDPCHQLHTQNLFKKMNSTPKK